MNQGLLLIFLLFLSCDSQEKGDCNRKQSCNKFKDLNSISQSNCILSLKKWRDLLEADEQDGVEEKYDLVNHAIVKITEKDNNLVLFCKAENEVASPVLVVVDKNCNIIDQQVLMSDWGNNEPSLKTIESLEIINSEKIVETDSVFQYRVDELGDRIEKSRKIKKHVYLITDKGAIKCEKLISSR